MRLPYVANPVPTANAVEAGIVERSIARRGAVGLKALDLTLLHSPPVTDGWNSFYTNIRQRTTLADDIREIAICRVAVLTKVEYEWYHHAPLARHAGVDVEVLRADGQGLTAKQMAVMRYTDAMTRDIEVPDAVVAELRKHFNDREVVEITITVAAYNCTSRFLVALDVGETNRLRDVTAWKTPS